MQIIAIKNTFESPEKYLEETSDILEQLIRRANYVSKLAANRYAAPKQGWASVLFTRLCNISISIYSLIPHNKYSIKKIENWDSSTIMALERNFIECYHTFFYLCIDKINEDEWKCRKKMFDLHDCTERRKMFESFNNQEQVISFLKTEDSLKTELKENAFFASLPDKQQNLLLKGEKALLLTNKQIQEKMGMDANTFKGLYKMQSHHTHSLPMSFYRMLDENRGRGVENDVDKGYIAQSAWVISNYLHQAINDMTLLFEDIFVKEILTRYLPLSKLSRKKQRFLANNTWTSLPRILLGNALVIR